MILYKNGLALIGAGLVKRDVLVNRGKIIEIAEWGGIVPDRQTEIVDCTGKYILPALVDVHTHGADGYDFNTADAEGMQKIMKFYVSHGVGTVLPTVMTDDEGRIMRQLQLICELAKQYPEIKGIHLEGPFLSEKYCGAMPVRYLQKPDFDKFLQFQQAAQGMIRLITVAPELDGAVEFIRKVSQTGVTVSLGHSAADGERVKSAIGAGARSFTHWGNAMSPLDRHDLNMAGSALLYDNFCEVICDGKHVDNGRVPPAAQSQRRGQDSGHYGQHNGDGASRRRLYAGRQRGHGEKRRRPPEKQRGCAPAARWTPTRGWQT